MNDSELKDLSSGDENEDNRDFFFASLFDFHQATGVDIGTVPQVNGCNIDLCALYRLVTKNGGYKKINRHSQWQNIQHLLRLPVRAMDPNEGQLISKIFHDYLRLFYDHLKRHQSPTLKAPRTRHVESTASIHRRPRRPLQPRVETQRNRGRGSSRRVASSEAVWSELSLAPNSTLSGSAEPANRAFESSRLITPAAGERSSQSTERSRKRTAKQRHCLGTSPRVISAASEEESFSASSLDRSISKRTAVEGFGDDTSNIPYTARRAQSVMSRGQRFLARITTSLVARFSMDELEIGTFVKVYWSVSETADIVYVGKILAKDMMTEQLLIHYPYWSSSRDEWVALRLIVAKDVSHPTRRTSISGIVRNVSGPILVGEISGPPSRAIANEFGTEASSSTFCRNDSDLIARAHRSETPIPMPRYHSDKPFCFYEGEMNDDSNDSFASNSPDQVRLWGYEAIKAHTALDSGQTLGDKHVLEFPENEAILVPDSRREILVGDSGDATTGVDEGSTQSVNLAEDEVEPKTVRFADVYVQTSANSEHREVATSPVEAVAAGVQVRVGSSSRTTQTELSAAMDPANSVRIMSVDDPAEISSPTDLHTPSGRHFPCFYCSGTLPFGMNPFMFGPQSMGGLSSIGTHWYNNPYYQNSGMLQSDELQRQSDQFPFLATSAGIARDIAEACTPLMFPIHPYGSTIPELEVGNRPAPMGTRLLSTASAFTSLTEPGSRANRPIRHFVPPRVSVPVRARTGRDRQRVVRSLVPRSMPSIHHPPSAPSVSTHPSAGPIRPRETRPRRAPDVPSSATHLSAQPAGPTAATPSSLPGDIKPVVRTLEVSQASGSIANPVTDTAAFGGNQNVNTVGLDLSTRRLRPPRGSDRPIGLLTETQDTASLSMADIVRISRVPRILIDEHVSNNDILSVFPPTVTDAAMYGFTPRQSLNILCLNNPVVLQPQNQLARDDLLGISNGTFDGVVTRDERFSVPVHPRNQLYQVVDHINLLLGRLRCIARIAQQETTRSDPGPTTDN